MLKKYRLHFGSFFLKGLLLILRKETSIKESWQVGRQEFVMFLVVVLQAPFQLPFLVVDCFPIYDQHTSETSWH